MGEPSALQQAGNILVSVDLERQCIELGRSLMGRSDRLPPAADPGWLYPNKR
jgi:hypothetical protein